MRQRSPRNPILRVTRSTGILQLYTGDGEMGGGGRLLTATDEGNIDEEGEAEASLKEQLEAETLGALVRKSVCLGKSCLRWSQHCL